MNTDLDKHIHSAIDASDDVALAILHAIDTGPACASCTLMQTVYALLDEMADRDGLQEMGASVANMVESIASDFEVEVIH